MNEVHADPRLLDQLAPGVLGYTVEHEGDLYLPYLQAEQERTSPMPTSDYKAMSLIERERQAMSDELSRDLIGRIERDQLPLALSHPVGGDTKGAGGKATVTFPAAEAGGIEPPAEEIAASCP